MHRTAGNADQNPRQESADSLATWRFYLADAEQTGALARELAALTQAGDVVLLKGQLGSGKTTWVRSFVAARGGDPMAVHSPTFSLVHQYDCGSAAAPVVHMDCYRLSGDEEWDSLGVDESMATAVTCIEWPERLADALPDEAECWVVELDHDGHGSRSAVVRPPRPWSPGTFAADFLALSKAEVVQS